MTPGICGAFSAFALFATLAAFYAHFRIDRLEQDTKKEPREGAEFDREETGQDGATQRGLARPPRPSR